MGTKEITNQDIGCLKMVLERDHEEVNITTIEKCLEGKNCWYKKILNKLERMEDSS